MATENITAPQQVHPRAAARWLFAGGWALLLLGLGLYVFQLMVLKQFVVPWYAPGLATLGVGLMLAATWQRWTVLRVIGLVLAALFVAGEWFFFVVLMRAPAYAGPAVGDPVPAFAALRADGRPFTAGDIQGQPTILVFFRGHWWLMCMQELGQLNEHFADFASRGLRIVAVSVDGTEDTARMQQRFPKLILVADPDRKMTETFQAIHKGVGPGHTDVAAPTTYLLDKAGQVRWVFRPDRVIERLTPGQLLSAVEPHLRAER